MKQSKITIILSLIILTGYTSCSQPMKSSYKIHWMDFESAVAASQKNPKKLFIDVYTDWCGWCKKMDASTFMDDSVAAYINANFYPVKFNAESKDTIHFFDQVFVFVPEYKSHELAISLLNRQMGYPSYAFLDEKFAAIKVQQGYMPKETLMPLLKYYAEDVYKTKTFEEFTK
jgi:thioredoxin-related protein